MKELDTVDICKRLFYLTGRINYRVLACAIENSDKIIITKPNLEIENER